MKKEEFPNKIYASIITEHYYAEDVRRWSPTDGEVEYIRADLVPKWHKYPDEKPICTGNYLVISDGDIRQLFYKDDKWLYDDGDPYEDLIVIDDVIAWMELPKPYKEN